MRGVATVLLGPLLVFATALALRAAGGRESVPMVCEVSDAGPREHVRASWDLPYGACFDPGGVPIGCPKRKDACPSIESWRCHPAGRSDIDIIGMEYCRDGWRESLDGG